MRREAELGPHQTHNFVHRPPVMKAAGQTPAVPYRLTKLQQRLLYEQDSDSSPDAALSSPASTASGDFSDVGTVSSSHSSRAAWRRQPSSKPSSKPSSPLGSSLAIQRVLMGGDPGPSTSAHRSQSQRHSVKAIAGAFEYVSNQERSSAPQVSLPMRVLGFPDSTSPRRTASSRSQSLDKAAPVSMSRNEQSRWHDLAIDEQDEDEPQFDIVASPSLNKSRLSPIPFPSYPSEATVRRARQHSADSEYSDYSAGDSHSFIDKSHSFSAGFDRSTSTADTTVSALSPLDIDLNRTPRPKQTQLVRSASDIKRSREQTASDLAALKREAQELLASIRALTSDVDSSATSTDTCFTAIEECYRSTWSIMDDWHWSTWSMSTAK